jgi:UDP-N-acetylglucosamine--N-acetylmuramyl-(pentapeptide) pyrophosphoryl-undecaprenol N-acetylglucosamine transferase
LLASTGGHLAELVALAPRLYPVAREELWVTFDTAQSRSILAGRRVEYIRNTPPRDWKAVLYNVAAARRILKGIAVESMVSSGAGIALSFLPLARIKGIPAHYIESSARMDGPSLTGRVLERINGVKLYTQHAALANVKWHYAGSTFDGYEQIELSQGAPIRKLVVTVGTLPFPFVRLLRRLREVLPEDVEVLIQSGAAGNTIAWPGADIREMLAPEELRRAIADADAVVAHAGIGSLLMALDAGKVPILVPRSARYREHVDNHQTDVARAFAREGLAVMAHADTIALDDLIRASTLGLRRAPDPPRFVLD